MEQIYGHFVQDGSEIRGIHLEKVFGGFVRGNEMEIQFLRGKDTVSVSMSLQTGMSLLSLLQAIQADTQEPVPPEPKRVF